MGTVTYISLSRQYLYYLYIILLSAIPCTLAAQEKYGLEFTSKDIDPDARTGVNFFAEKPLVTGDSFSLAFDLSFLPDAGSYFGYIFRLTDEKEQHIDLVFNMRTSSFDLIGGNAYTGISIKTPPGAFFHKWHNIRLDVNNKQRTFALWMNGKVISKAALTFSAGHKWKLAFGVSRYSETKIFDLPPMRLKDVRIYNDNQLTHHWPLRQYAGNTDTDIINGQTATVDHPIWLAHAYRNWQLSADFVTMGNASVAFDSGKGIVYICGRDSMYYYSAGRNILRADKLAHAQGLPAGNQAVFGDKQLYNFLTDLKKVSTYDKDNHSWDFNADNDSVTKFWHANRFYAAFDSSIYIIGGYGNYHFTNQVQRYSTANHTWEDIAASGDKYTPRYLSALGTTPNGDSAFIIGGYGSLTGDQLLDPHNLYDLHLFDAKAKTFRKIYQLPAPEKPFAFGNSMVIDTKTNSYYALTFGNDRMQSSLQLIKGSLLHPQYTKLADEIPFRYFDIRSSVELFYYAQGEKLVSVVLYTPENHVTQVRIYTIMFPPALLIASPVSSHQKLIWALIIAAVCLAGFLLFKGKVLLQGRYPAQSQTFEETHIVSSPSTVSPAMPDTKPAAMVTVSREETGRKHLVHSPGPYILLFGQFTVLDKEGNNISRLFSPLVKELFLLLLLHSLPDKNGITSDRINETLWPGRAAKDAKNNRSVNIVKLKNILDKLGPYTLEKENNKWMLHFDDGQVNIDLLQYFMLAGRKDNRSIQQLVSITGRGGFLAETEYSWLDKFKSDIAAGINTMFINVLHQRSGHSTPELIIAIANSMLNFDPLCEEAVIYKCRALVTLKQHASAKAIYNSFVKEYKDIYGEIFEKEYHEILWD